ncbi:MAG: class I SAM-dependent methyltransferase [Chloroflexi bacterium]|nr:MAG: class I SAM-dependent methyltransferase [Chloroflexota bacterium]
MNPYRCRVLRQMQPLLKALQPVSRVLDVGAGDGWFAMSVESMGICDTVTAIDVMPRPRAYHLVKVYDGQRLPYPDNTFDLVYAVDVVHHADDPPKLLAEMARCTGHYLLLKDHTWRTRMGWLALAAMDEVGNRRFGVPSIYNYQHRWEWDAILQKAGLKRTENIHPLACHARLLGRLTNSLQFLALWERAEAPSTTSLSLL